MIKGILVTLFVLCVGSVALGQDPVKVDPNHYKVEFENSEVRVLRVKVGPGEKSIMHQHPNAVAVFMTDINGKFTFPDGKTEATTRKAGDALWTPATSHLPENTGDQPFEVILVELKSKPSVKKEHHGGRRR